MRIEPRLLILLVFLGAAPGIGAAQSAAGGTVTGRVALVKDGKHITPVNVFVYLEELHPKHHKQLVGQGMKAQIRQKERNFTPKAIVVPVGTEVAFPNADREEHNVFSSSDPAFDLGRYNTDKTGKSRVFKDTGEMEIFCDIHPTMAAMIKVVETTWIAAVGTDGNFTIAGVPSGTYRVLAWAPNSVAVPSEEIAMTEHGSVTIQELHLQYGEWKQHHLRKDGSVYKIYP